MKIFLQRNFKKQYGKLTPGQQKRFRERRDLFVENPFHPILNNHRLLGKYKGFRSINVTGDLRVIFEELDDKKVVFHIIDTHSNLYR